MLAAVAALSVLQASAAYAAAVQHQLPFLSHSDPSDVGQAPAQDHEWNVLHHLAGISPYFNSHGPDPSPPEGCEVVNIAMIARHGSITMNDDEWPDTFEPFLEQLEKYKKSKIPKDASLAFLKDWQSPVSEDNMEEFTEPGARDAEAFGKRLADRYKHLMPGGQDDPFRIFSASSDRDLDSAHAFIHGMFPGRTIGNNTGDIELVSVPNKAADWKFSLTPHKACERYDKTVGKKERKQWQQKYTKQIIKRLRHELPGWKWHWYDIVAMQQLCGYETAIRGKSPFCSVFTQEEFENFEYGEDLFYYYQAGRNNKWTAALGIPWLQIAARKLNDTQSPAGGPASPKAAGTPTKPYLARLDDDHPPPPKPTKGPNETLAQPLHVWFTHREEIPFVTHALDLFHGHTKISKAMPLHRVNRDRIFKSSEILPFLGNVILERLKCPNAQTGRPDAFVRAIVNGSPKVQPMCHDGPEGTCPLDEFIRLVDKLPGIYGNLDKVCKKLE